MENHLLTAGGRIQCLRCTARSTRTHDQCLRPALTASKTQKCQFHGGRSTGPKTEEGKSRIAALHTVHGQATKIAKVEHSAASAKLSQIEDAAYLVEIMTGPRTRGRKANGYVIIKTVDHVLRMMIDDFLHRV